MHTVAIVLYIAEDKTEEFENEFRKHEFPVWEDLVSKGTMVRASLQRLEIESVSFDGAVEYMVVAVFPGQDHEAHDRHAGFRKWNERADRFQVSEPLAFGGNSLIEIG